MNHVFADTAYFIALLRANDEFHAVAHQFSASDGRPVLTTSAVIQELGATFYKVDDRPIFLAILAALERGRGEILHVSEALQRRDRTFYEKTRQELVACGLHFVPRRGGPAHSGSGDL